jgi:hypothetical protein
MGRRKRGQARLDPATYDGMFQITPTAGTAPVRLGTQDLRSFLTGELDEVAIYDKVLSPEQIRVHYNVGELVGAFKRR